MVEVWLRLADGIGETVAVTPLGDDHYRLENVPLSASLADVDVTFGDTIKAEHDSDGGLRFRAVVARSRLKQYDFLIGRDLAESAELDAFADSVKAVEGYIERVMGGMVFVYVPPDSDFDPKAELDKANALVRARLRG